MLARAVDQIRTLTHAFERKWGLWFPVPPRVGGRLPRLYSTPDRKRALLVADVIPKAVPSIWPERLMTSAVVNPVREVRISDSLLILDIWLPAGKLVFNFISGRLDHVQRHDDWVPDDRGAPPRPMGRRIAKKGLERSEISVQPLDADWIRLEVSAPQAVHLSEIKQRLNQALQRAPFALRASLEHYGQVFLMVRERSRRTTKQQRGDGADGQPENLSRVELGRRLALAGDPIEEYANLKRAYRRWCAAFGLPRPRISVPSTSSS